MAAKKPTNPFYAVLVVAGVAFTITACAYGVMTVRGMRGATEPAASGLISFLERHGFRLLMIELGVLAIATVLAMATDDYWTRRGQAR